MVPLRTSALPRYLRLRSCAPNSDPAACRDAPLFLEIAGMFMLYEFAGIFTNLFGGILRLVGAQPRFARTGSATSVNPGGAQVIFSSRGSAANVSLAGNVSSRDGIPGDNTLASSDAAPIRFRYMIYICFVQGLAGVGKDLMKVSGKSITKLVNKSSDNGALFKMVVYITGAKNTVKGVGYLMGGVVLLLGYWQGVCFIAAIVFAAIPPVLWYVDQGLAVSKRPPSVRDVFSNISRNVGMLSLQDFGFSGRETSGLNWWRCSS